MPGEIRRGKAAIQEANESSGRGGGDFKPFLPALLWKEDKEEKYLFILTPMEETPQFDMIRFIETERGYPEEAVAKTDQYFGQKNDQFVEEWDATPRTTNFAIAIELEPVVEVVNKRSKAKSFEVMTKDFSRKVVDDDGEITDETEDVTTPVIGYIAQSPSNFFNVLRIEDDTNFPVHETPVKIVRVGKDSNTTYSVTGYEEQDIDFSNLFEYLDGVTYLGDELEPLLEKIEDMETREAAYTIGDVLLTKRIEEILDDERYEELFEGVSESMDKFGSKKKRSKAKEKKTARASRPTQRRKATEEPVDEPESEPEETPAKREKVSKSAPGKTKLDALRERTKAKSS